MLVDEAVLDSVLQRGTPVFEKRVCCPLIVSMKGGADRVISCG